MTTPDRPIDLTPNPHRGFSLAARNEVRYGIPGPGAGYDTLMTAVRFDSHSVLGFGCFGLGSGR